MAKLDNLRKTAKRWLKSLRDGDAEARARLRRAYPAAPERATLRDVQHALAREGGYESWIALIRATAANPAGEPPLLDLLDAAGKGDVSTLATIVGKYPSLVDERGVLPPNTGLRTALHFGVGHEAVVKLLLDRGANPNIRDEGDDAFPLHFAAERGDLSIVKLLVEHGADPVGAGTIHELDVVGWAVCFEYANNVDVARYLLAHGARYTLWSAVALGEAGVVRELVRSGEELNQRMDRTNHRRTPLHLAIVKQQMSALAALVELGANLNLEDAVGLTPLDQAALNGEDAMTRLLLDAGAAFTLPAAIVLERADQIERIVNDNPELLSTTDNRRWARLLVRASDRASGRVMETLLRTIMRHRSGLSIVNMEDDQETSVDGATQYTALHAAAFRGNDEAVRVLLKHGANPRTRDGKYCGTPAGWAAFAGHMETARLILEAEIDVFDAINFDRADRVADILERDPGAIDRPFKAYATPPPPRPDQWWPAPDCTPLEWASSQNKQNAVRALIERGAAMRTPDDLQRTGRVVLFLQSACWDEHQLGRRSHRMNDLAAQRLLAADPWIARDNLYSAIVCGEIADVARILEGRPEAASEPGGPRNWTPILYLAYARFTHPPTNDNALAIARLLLDCGANPNDFYMAGDAQYTVLAGVAGEGEGDAPRQPYAAALFELLLERGARPFDIQVLYNTHFSGDMVWWLELVHKHTTGTAVGAAWQDSEWTMFDMGGYGSGARFVLETAVKTRKRELAEWALAHGANPNAASARDRRFPRHSLYELATLHDAADIGELLARHGAATSAPALNDHERFMLACFRLDGEEARRLSASHPEYLQAPAALLEAARRDRPDVLALLVDLGTPLDVQDQTGKRALHDAAAGNALRAARFLIEHGAEIDPRESTFGGTPLSWAAHGDKTAMMDLLSRHSRDIWALCFNGYVDRVREILEEDPNRGRVVTKDGATPLWWLPDDEAKAMEIVELLLAAGADPSAKSTDGETAAEQARRRAMHDVANRIEQAT